MSGHFQDGRSLECEYFENTVECGNNVYITTAGHHSGSRGDKASGFREIYCEDRSKWKNVQVGPVMHQDDVEALLSRKPNAVKNFIKSLNKQLEKAHERMHGPIVGRMNEWRPKGAQNGQYGMNGPTGGRTNGPLDSHNNGHNDDYSFRSPIMGSRDSGGRMGAPETSLGEYETQCRLVDREPVETTFRVSCHGMTKDSWYNEWLGQNNGHNGLHNDHNVEHNDHSIEGHAGHSGMDGLNIGRMGDSYDSLHSPFCSSIHANAFWSTPSGPFMPPSIHATNAVTGDVGSRHTQRSFNDQNGDIWRMMGSMNDHHEYSAWSMNGPYCHHNEHHGHPYRPSLRSTIHWLEGGTVGAERQECQADVITHRSNTFGDFAKRPSFIEINKSTSDLCHDSSRDFLEHRINNGHLAHHNDHYGMDAQNGLYTDHHYGPECGVDPFILRDASGEASSPHVLSTQAPIHTSHSGHHYSDSAGNTPYASHVAWRGYECKMFEDAQEQRMGSISEEALVDDCELDGSRGRMNGGHYDHLEDHHSFSLRSNHPAHSSILPPFSLGSNHSSIKSILRQAICNNFLHSLATLPEFVSALLVDHPRRPRIGLRNAKPINSGWAWVQSSKTHKWVPKFLSLVYVAKEWHNDAHYGMNGHYGHHNDAPYGPHNDHSVDHWMAHSGRRNTEVPGQHMETTKNGFWDIYRVYSTLNDVPPIRSLTHSIYPLVDPMTTGNVETKRIPSGSTLYLCILNEEPMDISNAIMNGEYLEIMRVDTKTIPFTRQMAPTSWLSGFIARTLRKEPLNLVVIPLDEGFECNFIPLCAAKFDYNLSYKMERARRNRVDREYDQWLFNLWEYVVRTSDKHAELNGQYGRMNDPTKGRMMDSMDQNVLQNDHYDHHNDHHGGWKRVFSRMASVIGSMFGLSQENVDHSVESRGDERERDDLRRHIIESISVDKEASLRSDVCSTEATSRLEDLPIQDDNLPSPINFINWINRYGFDDLSIKMNIYTLVNRR